LSSRMGSSGPIVASLKWPKNMALNTSLDMDRTYLWHLKSCNEVRNYMLLFCVMRERQRQTLYEEVLEPTRMVQSYSSPVSKKCDHSNLVSPAKLMANQRR